MKIDIDTVIENSVEWEDADEEIKKNFEKYLDTFFHCNKGKDEMPLTFKKWLSSVFKYNVK